MERMETGITSFLLRCSADLDILFIYWSFPIQLISPYQKTMRDLFLPSQMERMNSLVQQTLSSNYILDCEEPFSIITPQTEVSLHMISMGDGVLVYGYEEGAFSWGTASSAAGDIARMFMKVIRLCDQHYIADDKNAIRDQFEHIQKLNNELLNTHRQLAKANAKLNQLNDELNNRLVKDSLTGLVSRYQYREEIKRTIAKAPDKLGIFAFIDLDDFKKINDTYGHSSGDLFLKEFARRLMSLPISNYISIRIAGDEFGLYIHGYESVDDDDIMAIWEMIRRYVLASPIELQTAVEPVACSVGMSVYGKDTNDIFTLIDYSDFAMYEAKNGGKNECRRFDILRYSAIKNTGMGQARV